MKPFLQRLVSITAFTLVFMSCLSSPIALQAKPTITRSAPIRFNPPPPPPDRGAPGNRGEGASRGECAALDLPLTALVPSYKQRLSNSQEEGSTMTKVWGLTSVEQPSFWFYVPYHQSDLQAIEFVLQTDKNKTIYRTPVSVPQAPGIVRVQLQNTTTPLETNKQYHWFFKVSVVCDPKQPPTLDYVEGWVQRVNLDAALRNQLKQPSPQQQVAIYALEGIWYDALTTLAELRLASPQDPRLAEDWKSLLKVIGLEKVATQPLIQSTR
ncbi:hypothetical protein SAMD00079811_62610 [Scytonema sp. HK-05]|uniref:DUF928 domain-containing protein n=1 Tax=Scytonema sp. HK-05 TaxID=1137095 RepID=UPI000937A0B9|nr:DUF928 domain-containing protein [Scytonema sp. HK-05]OKH57267.1 hypothetical protein NIES2130_20720 [Scytonema sp. HK-05]BAY48635.1 hypothetical protein SAMD00079811_62610 [Scytonema sp. HK-05]